MENWGQNHILSPVSCERRATEVVLSSRCVPPDFYAVFKNSGVALSTMIIPIALAAPPFYNVPPGVAAAVFAMLLNIVSKKLFTG